MGRVFVTEREGDVYTCSSCATQIAHRDDFLADWGNIYDFSDVYNVTIGEKMVYKGYGMYYGYEVFCVNCCRFLGWKELDIFVDEEVLKLFRIDHPHVVPPPPSPGNLPPPPSPGNLPPPPPEVQP